MYSRDNFLWITGHLWATGLHSHADRNYARTANRIWKKEPWKVRYQRIDGICNATCHVRNCLWLFLQTMMQFELCLRPFTAKYCFHFSYWFINWIDNWLLKKMIAFRLFYVCVLFYFFNFWSSIIVISSFLKPDACAERIKKMFSFWIVHHKFFSSIVYRAIMFMDFQHFTGVNTHVQKISVSQINFILKSLTRPTINVTISFCFNICKMN